MNALIGARLRRLVELPGVLHKRRLINREFASKCFPERGGLKAYERELKALGLVEELAAKEDAFMQRVSGTSQRGKQYKTGCIKMAEALKLYAIVRKFRPRVAVETGVCNGFSSAFLLLALRQNGEGRLYSIDLPEVAGQEYAEGTFWSGKQGAVIPQGEGPGWIIPDRLRAEWELVLGKSQDVLPPLLGRLGEIDFFLHDSEHSYDCMSFEFAQAYSALRPGGILMADDTTWNTAFQDFAASRGKEVVRVSRKMSLLFR